MKRFLLAIMMVTVFLTGCNRMADPTGDGLALRQKLLAGKGCAFSCVINADFGDTEYAFALECEADEEGKVQFRVMSPETISKITGSIDAQSGKLTFDETALTFPLLAQGEIPPVCAPWLFYKILTGGYIREAGEDADGLRLTIDDSFHGENICLEVWIESDAPKWAELVWQGRKILTLDISQFRIL